MRGNLRVLCAGALAVLVYLSSFAAFAQDPSADQASRLIDQGVELRIAKRDSEALELFRRAYDISPTPRALAQIGLAEQALGRWVLAEEHLTSALSNPDEPWIRKNKVVLQDSLKAVQTHLGSLEIESNVVGAEVFVNDVSVGRTPMARPARVPAASAVISVRAKGYVSAEVRRDIAAEDLVRESIVLVSQREAVPPLASAPAPGTSTAPNQALVSEKPPAAESSSQRSWGYVSAGVGLAGLATTGILAGLAVGKTSGLPDSCRNDPNHGCTASQGDNINAARGYASIANVTFGVGLLGIGLGSYLLIAAPSPSKASANQIQASPLIGSGFGGFRLGGAF